ncbi:LmeA family phospholipid-binding protein [Streptomyces sp. NPDC087917]|uniref:LmeA family phospholipid-binding protein n=1 Tax=unclassified Streptomyces TaxID=2593676 RepID=UPI00343C15A7
MNKRRRIALIASTCLVAVAALGVTDTVVEGRAERRVADAAGCRLDAAKGVHVDLTEPLAGLRALTGSVGTVRIEADGVRRQDMDLKVTAVLHGVSTDGSTSGGAATATAPYDQLAAGQAGRDPGLAGLKAGTDGAHLTLTGSTGGAGGGGLPVTVTADLTTTSNSVTVTPATLTVLGQRIPVGSVTSLPGAARFADRLAPRTLPVTGLPEGAEITGARATADGLAVDLSLPAGPAPDTGAGKRCAGA